MQNVAIGSRSTQPRRNRVSVARSCEMWQDALTTRDDSRPAVWRDQDAQESPSKQLDLWRVHKGNRERQCVAVYFRTGADLRLMEGADFRRTQLVTGRASAHVAG